MFWSADIDWRAIEGAPDDVGRDARGGGPMRRYYLEWLEMFDGITNVPEELLDVGG